MKITKILAVLGLVVSANVCAEGAIVIMVDDECVWGDELRTAVGDVLLIGNDGDQWVLACQGDIVDGVIPDRTIVFRSTEENPLAECFTPFGTTPNIQIVATRSGKAKINCHGSFSNGN